MDWIEKSGLTVGVFPAAAVAAPDLEVWVTTRTGGASEPPYDSLNLGGLVGDRPSAVRENRRRLLAALGIKPGRIVRSVQAHGSRIAVVDRPAKLDGYDGFVTAAADLTLVISTADCYSVVVYSPPERVLAALHVGRRGAAAGIIPEALGILRDRYRVCLRYAHAFIGPGICGACYAVPRSEALRFPRPVRSFAHGSWRLDLDSFCARELRKGGLEPEGIHRSGLCTSCTPSLFFSHRRDGARTGRQWTLATIRPR